MRAIVIPLVGLSLACSGSYPPHASALEALVSDANVTVSQDPWISFTPTGGSARVGFIFYPGGKVEPEAYAPPVRKIAEAGHLSVIVPMPADLAFFGQGRGSDVVAAHPEIDAWVVGGHSLGGVAAAGWVNGKEAPARGIVFWASYPADGDDLSATDLAVATVYGTEDGVAPPEDILATVPLLPADAAVVPIEGGNHAQFGAYGAQEGDNPATIDADTQHTQAAEATLDVLLRVDATLPS